MLRRISVLSTLVMAASLCACEQSGETGETSQTTSKATTSEDQRPEPPKPPQEAFDACKSLVEGAGCKVAIGDKSIDGTCRKGPDGNATLACVPEPPTPPPEHRGPPPEAIDACKSLAENAACTVKIGDKSINGACSKGPEASAALACKPSNMPPPPVGRGHRGPPQAAIDACKSLAESAACSVKFGDKSVDGTCRKGPGESATLACAPSDMPPPPAHHHRGPPPQAFEACKALAENAACTVSFGTRTIDGICRKGPDGKGALACAPANMPPPPPVQ